MKTCIGALLLLGLTACSADKGATMALATRLVDDGGQALSQQQREAYIGCGVTALSNLPDAKIDAALKAPDAPAIWDILGSEALDAYVKTCREAGPRPAA